MRQPAFAVTKPAGINGQHQFTTIRRSTIIIVGNSGLKTEILSPSEPATSNSIINAMAEPLCPPKARSAPPSRISEGLVVGQTITINTNTGR